MNIVQKLNELGLYLPPSPKAAALYATCQKYKDEIWISGQLPFQIQSNSDQPSISMTGQVDRNIEQEQSESYLQQRIQEAKEAMKLCFLNGLACASKIVNIEEITGVMKLGAYTSCSPFFTQQHIVANGASELSIALFGEEKGKCVRFAVGVCSLPLNASVELEMILSL